MLDEILQRLSKPNLRKLLCGERSLCVFVFVFAFVFVFVFVFCVRELEHACVSLISISR